MRNPFFTGTAVASFGRDLATGRFKPVADAPPEQQERIKYTFADWSDVWKPRAGPCQNLVTRWRREDSRASKRLLKQYEFEPGCAKSFPEGFRVVWACNIASRERRAAWQAHQAARKALRAQLRERGMAPTPLRNALGRIMRAEPLDHLAPEQRAAVLAEPQIRRLVNEYSAQRKVYSRREQLLASLPCDQRPANRFLRCTQQRVRVALRVAQEERDTQREARYPDCMQFRRVGRALPFLRALQRPGQYIHSANIEGPEDIDQLRRCEGEVCASTVERSERFFLNGVGAVMEGVASAVFSRDIWSRHEDGERREVKHLPYQWKHKPLPTYAALESTYDEAWLVPAKSKIVAWVAQTAENAAVLLTSGRVTEPVVDESGQPWTPERYQSALARDPRRR